MFVRRFLQARAKFLLRIAFGQLERNRFSHSSSSLINLFESERARYSARDNPDASTCAPPRRRAEVLDGRSDGWCGEADSRRLPAAHADEPQLPCTRACE